MVLFHRHSVLLWDTWFYLIIIAQVPHFPNSAGWQGNSSFSGEFPVPLPQAEDESKETTELALTVSDGLKIIFQAQRIWIGCH